jgi:hypothetical protein
VEFFSFSHSKLIGYIIPCFLPAAILLAQVVNSLRVFKLFVPVFCALLLLWPYVDNRSSSAKDIVREVIKIKEPDEEILSFGAYYQDIPVYAGLGKVYTSHNIGELDFGVSVAEEKPCWILGTDDFDKIWCSEKKFIAIARISVFEKYFSSQNGPIPESVTRIRNFVIFRNHKVLK